MLVAPNQNIFPALGFQLELKRCHAIKGSAKKRLVHFFLFSLLEGFTCNIKTCLNFLILSYPVRLVAGTSTNRIGTHKSQDSRLNLRDRSRRENEPNFREKNDSIRAISRIFYNSAKIHHHDFRPWKLRNFDQALR